MALTSNRTTFTFNHSGQVDEYGASVGDFTVVQANYDSRGQENLDDINNIKTTLKSTTDGDSGADNVGATPFGDITGDTVQEQCEQIRDKITSLMPVPDDSITDAKLKQTGNNILPNFNTTKAAFQAHLIDLSAHATTAAITYYVNVSTGSDTNDGLTSGTAFKTITKAINSLPRFIDHSVTINVAAGDYSAEGTIVISGFSGKNFISVLGDTTASTSYSFSRVNVLRCATNIYIRGFNCTSTVAQHFTCSYCKYVILEACNSTASASVNGFHISSGTAAYIKNCVSSNKGAAIYCENSNIYSENNSGTGNSIGLYCVQAGKIGKKGTQPGGTAAETIDGGGQIV